MTQPAKVQEPSMEEILASIRRIIADDEAKPPAGEKPPAVEKPASPAAPAKPEKPAAATPAAKPAAMADIPPPAAPAVAKAPPPLLKPAAPEPPASAANSQDDIDALLNGLDEATSADEIRPPLPDGEVFELTDAMAVPEPPQQQQRAFHKIEPDDDLEFTETAAARAVHRQPAYEPPPFESAAPPPQAQQILSRSTVSAVESAFNTLANTVLSNNARTLEDLVKEMLRPMLKSWLDDNLPGLVERIVKAEIERVSRGR
jgi:cell pole-organizing protein PopZ